MLEEHSNLMDRIYRWQRFIYDPLRKYFLFGRDKLLVQMDIRPNDRVLEIGCGTARNLVKLARRYPKAHFYGLDASREMLKSADSKLRFNQMTGKIVLRQGLAEELDRKENFGLKEPFDVIFFSYTLSMVPDVLKAIEAALANLKNGRILYVVDFWDQAELPGWFRSILQWWLKFFHTCFHPEMIEGLKKLETEWKGTLEIKSVMRRYAYIAAFKKK